MVSKEEGPVRVLPRDLRPKKKPTSGYPSFFGLWGEKTPTWGCPSSLRTWGREEAHPFLLFSFFSFFFLFLFFFVFLGGGREGKEKEEAYLKVPFFSSDFWARRSPPGGTLFYYFLFFFFLPFPFFLCLFGRREGGEGEGRSLPQGTLLLFRLLGEKKPTWWHPSFLIVGVVLCSCRDPGDLWCRIARRKCWRTPSRLTGEWSGIACSETDVWTRWQCRRCCSNIPTEGCGRNTDKQLTAGGRLDHRDRVVKKNGSSEIKMRRLKNSERRLNSSEGSGERRRGKKDKVIRREE